MPSHLNELEKVIIIHKVEEGRSIRYLNLEINVFLVLISKNKDNVALADYLRQNPFESAQIATIITDFPGSRLSCT